LVSDSTYTMVRQITVVMWCYKQINPKATSGISAVRLFNCNSATRTMQVSSLERLLSLIAEIFAVGQLQLNQSPVAGASPTRLQG